MSKKYLDIGLSIFFIVLAVLLYRSTASFPKSTIFTTAVYIKFLAISLGLAGVVYFFNAIISDKYIKIVFTHNPKKFFLLILSLVVYVWVMHYLGFIVSTLIFLPVTMRFMGYNAFIKSLFISIGIALFVYFLFERIFEIQLPEMMIFMQN
ncbi:tripartite tricarboxylate transporter TctB family protein [Sulfurospirillum sp. 1612]|uniref:tripartite tricarboxylate transporter TctB family protein n=1 Tax=Sulfurospirillum sp. 1612 TaxID=3094835 RepID=UPI002F92C4B7